MNVSVLMTAYNREDFIAEAIDSVLASTYDDYELIIVDDCSNDKTVEIARSYEAKNEKVKVYVNEQNLGDYQNRNKAASYAKGKYIKYLDSDDIMYKHCLQVMVHCMEAFPEAGYGLCSIQDKKAPYPVILSPHDTYIEHFYGFGHFNRAPGSAIILKEAFDKVGGFTGKRMIGDMEMWFVLSRFFSMVKIPAGLIWTRSHAEQESQTDFAKKYDKLTNNVVADSFKNDSCPLTKKEIQAIRKKTVKQKLKQKALRFFG